MFQKPYQIKYFIISVTRNKKSLRWVLVGFLGVGICPGVSTLAGTHNWDTQAHNTKTASFITYTHLETTRNIPLQTKPNFSFLFH